MAYAIELLGVAEKALRNRDLELLSSRFLEPLSCFQQVKGLQYRVKHAPGRSKAPMYRVLLATLISPSCDESIHFVRVRGAPLLLAMATANDESAVRAFVDAFADEYYHLLERDNAFVYLYVAAEGLAGVLPIRPGQLPFLVRAKNSEAFFYLLTRPSNRAVLISVFETCDAATVQEVCCAHSVDVMNIVVQHGNLRRQFERALIRRVMVIPWRPETWIED